MKFSELRKGQIWEDDDGDYVELFYLTHNEVKFRIARPVRENMNADVWKQHGTRVAKQWEAKWTRDEWDTWSYGWRLVTDVGNWSEQADAILEELRNGPAG